MHWEDNEAAYCDDAILKGDSTFPLMMMIALMMKYEDGDYISVCV